MLRQSELEEGLDLLQELKDCSCSSSRGPQKSVMKVSVPPFEKRKDEKGYITYHPTNQTEE